MSQKQNPKIIAGAGARPSHLAAWQAARGLADAPACGQAFLRFFGAPAEAAAGALDAAQAAGLAGGPLAGWLLSVKDLFDVAGQPSTAASAALADAAPASADCPAVARLRAAGALLLGHTNLSEFAFSGVGINPHHGTPVNAGTMQLDPTPRAPGGSTSGGATSVAAGVARAALGSDTGGSIRIPAALQGLVGFKNTQRLTPLAGCIPLSPTLDTACAITRNVADAVAVHAVLAARRPRLAGRPLYASHFAVPQAVVLEGLDSTVAQAFERTLHRLRAAGARVQEVALPELAEPAGWLPLGSFAAAESWHWHRERLAQREKSYDPRVALRIRRGQAMSAADYLELQRLRADWILRMQAALAPFDALLCPTVPLVAPPLAPLLHQGPASDDAFFAVNAALLRNPTLVNLLDGCALSLPCQAPDELPVGLMVWGPALTDDRVLDAALAIEAALAEGA
ncbi:amidase, Asp-tRNAAsn/Glu-tRNAGln amidotransferase A subunit [Burkholderiales bacterium JOSHI_001]|nr:amidase, Asp-tRNAAsn/Glu-tRNAGln amidotransferase A subunit [Burkholderiales bacterium JOSHI_001]